jgi:hypothetical protein
VPCLARPGYGVTYDLSPWAGLRLARNRPGRGWRVRGRAGLRRRWLASSRRGTGPSDSRRETHRGLRPGLHMAAGRPRPREGRGRVPRPDQPERRESHRAAGGVPGPRLWASERRIVRKGSPARIRGAVHGREDAPLQAGEDRAKIFKGLWSVRGGRRSPSGQGAGWKISMGHWGPGALASFRSPVSRVVFMASARAT